MEYVIVLLLKSTLIISCLFILLLFFRHSAAEIRHWLISLTLIGLILFPFLEMNLPRLSLAVPEQLAKNPAAAAVLTVVEQRESQVLSSSVKEVPVAKRLGEAEPVETTALASSAARYRWHPTQSLFVLWLAGLVLLLVRGLLGVRLAYRYAKRSDPFYKMLDPGWLKALQQRVGLKRRVSILLSSEINTPMTWGCFKPVILLPKDAANWRETDLETVLLHEMAHIRRNDFLLHLLGYLCVSIYWCNPLVWKLKKEQTLEREKACDESVLGMGIGRHQYAEQLVGIARMLSKKERFLAGYALPMAKYTQIKHRVMAILDFKEISRWVLRTYRWSASSILMLSVFISAAATPINKPVKTAVKELFAVDLDAESMLPMLPVKVKNDQAIAGKEPKLTKNQKAVMKAVAPLPSLEIIATKEVKSTLQKEKLSVLSVPRSVKEKMAISQQEGYYGVWAQGKSQFRVWTYGSFTALQGHPYFDFTSDDAMVVVEESRKTILGGTKTFRAIITNAPYKGVVVQSFIGGKPNSFTHGFKEGQTLVLFFVDDEWSFLSKGSSSWMKDKMPSVLRRIEDLSSEEWKSKNQTDAAWWSFIQEQQSVKEIRFQPDSILPPERKEYIEALIDTATQRSRDLQIERKWTSVPYVPTEAVPASQSPVEQNFGPRKEIGTTSGFSGSTSQGGMYRFGRMIRNIKRGGVAQDFNFHLGHNLFKYCIFKLQLYRVENGEVVAKLNRNPIPIELENRTEGWMTIDLERHGIGVGGDVLAIIELDLAEARGPKAGAFFSHCLRPYNFLTERPRARSGKQKNNEIGWEFWEGNFAFNMTVRY